MFFVLALLGACNGKGGGSGTPGQAGAGGGTAGGAAGATAGAGVAGASGGSGGSATGGSGGSTGVAGQAGSSQAGSAGGAGGAVAAAPCSAPADPLKPIAKLSQTGCMSATDVTKMASIVVPYEVNSPLWSDGADKFRGFVVPAGKKIHVKNCTATPSDCPTGTQDNGKWVFPVGTVMVKSFGFDNKLIETRLLVKADATTWNGYSYQWNEAQTEATIVPADELLNNVRAMVNFNTGKQMVTWHFPYRFDCGICHTQEAGGTLGLETRQINRVVGGMNQIDKIAGMGLFETAPAKPYQAALLLPYTGQLGTADTTPATLDQRARSYLHANCSNCHRPDAQAVAWLDFRYDTTLKNTAACGMAPMKGDAGSATPTQIIKPTDPMHSTMWLRMTAPWKDGDKTRMPQLATYVVDAAGTKLISDWITSITTCP